MGNTAIQTNLVTPGQTAGLQNLTDNLLEVFKALLAAKVPGISGFYKGLRAIEAEDVLVPCVMVQPAEQSPAMITTAKFQKFYVFDFWFVVGGNTVDATTVAAADIAEIFVKLFSNNANNDRYPAPGTPPYSNNYKAYGTNWVDSEMTKVSIGVPFLLPKENGGTKYVALGNFQLKIQTVTLV